jgi:hypothetical protein
VVFALLHPARVQQALTCVRKEEITERTVPAKYVDLIAVSGSCNIYFGGQTAS